jgi:hypothetical protein
MNSALNINDLIKKKNIGDSATIYRNHHYDLNTPTPSLSQGTILKKYQTKIIKNTEKKISNIQDNEIKNNKTKDTVTKKVNYFKKDSKEGFQNLNVSNDGLTSQSMSVLEKTLQSNNNESFLKKNYDYFLKQYNNLMGEISGDTSDYLKRTDPTNPYLNKILKFNTGEYAYVTNQGVVKYMANKELLLSKNYVDVNIPWLSSYSTPGTIVQTNPKLIIGTPLQKNQSVGNEGNNIFVDRLINNSKATYSGCYADNLTQPTMTFIGGNPSQGSFIKNGDFSQPQLSSNTYSLIKSTSDVPFWNFNAFLANSSDALGFPLPYPSGNQCVAVNRKQNISQVVTLTESVKYSLSFMTVSSNNTQSFNTIYIDLISSNGSNINISSFTPSSSTGWENYSTSFTIESTGSYNILFRGTSDNDCTTAIQNINLLLYGESISGNYNYDMCKQEAISAGVKYFGLQNVNPSTGLGYCGIGTSEPSITQYGISYVPTKQIALWSSNTSSQPGNSFVLTTQGSISVVNSSGTSVYSTPNDTAMPSNYYGCYGDSGDRAMELYNGGSQQYSNSQCQEIAKQGGYQFYGLQNSSSGTNAQCVLSNDFGNSTRYGKAGNCTKLSDGSWSGGGWSNAIYNTNNPISNYFLILQDDGNMVIYRGSNPNDIQSTIWSSGTVGKQNKSNPAYAATKGKYGQNWIPSGSTLAPGDFIGSNSGNIVLIMQTDGNLVFYTFNDTENCFKMSDGNIGGGIGANALNQLSEVGIQSNLAKLAYVDENSEIHTYPSSNIQLTTDYIEFKLTNSPDNDIPGTSYGNATVEQCKSTCNSTAGCYGFVMANEGDICMPKTSNMYPVSDKQMDINYTTYIKKRAPLNPPTGVSMNVNNIDSISYQNYIDGGDFNNTYGLANATNEQKQQLTSLEKQLNGVASQMSQSSSQFKDNNKLVSSQTIKNVKGINTYLNDLNNTNKEINNFSENVSSNLNNILNDSDIFVLQQNYDYLFWAILASGLVLVSMNILK